MSRIRMPFHYHFPGQLVMDPTVSVCSQYCWHNRRMWTEAILWVTGELSSFPFGLSIILGMILVDKRRRRCLRYWNYKALYSPLMSFQTSFPSNRLETPSNTVLWHPMIWTQDGKQNLHRLKERKHHIYFFLGFLLSLDCWILPFWS